MGSHRQVNVRSPHCIFLLRHLLLATSVVRRWLEEEGRGDRVTEWISAGQLSNISSWCGVFLPNSFDLKVGRCRPHLEFWQRVIKERQENVTHSDLSGVSRQLRECNCVCSGGTSSDSTTIKEVDFSNFDLTYLHSCLYRPPPPPPTSTSLRARTKYEEIP